MEDERELAKEKKATKQPENGCTDLTERMIRCCKLMFYLCLRKVSS